MHISVPGKKSEFYYATVNENKIPSLNVQVFCLCHVWMCGGWKDTEHREECIPELGWLIQHFSSVLITYAETHQAYQSTVEIKAAFTSLSLISLFLIAILTKEKQLFIFQILGSTSQINPSKQLQQQAACQAARGSLKR